MLRIIIPLLVTASLPLSANAQNINVEKTTIPLSAVDKTITADLFPINFLVGDSNYHSIVSASDGNLYFSVDTHNIDHSCRIYKFDPRTEEMTLLAKMDEVLGEDTATHVAQGKIHTPFFEDEGKLWFGTHISFYNDGLPGFLSEGRMPYQGGHLMSYDLKTGAFEDLAKIFPGEGIITMAMDTERNILYGLTWPSGILVSYDIAEGHPRFWGAVQERGEWGSHPHEWDRICRTLGVAPDGKVYGSTMDGRIWEFDLSQDRPVTYIAGLDLKRLPLSQSAAETLKGDFQYHWRVIEWNPKTESFWGIQWETTTLFEFRPSARYLRTVGELRHKAYWGMPRNPEISQLGFLLGPEDTIFYLANGPAVDIEVRPSVQSTVYLFTFDMMTEAMVNHGPVLSKDGRRVFFTEGLCIGSDDRLYSVAWVEVTDRARIEEINRARKAGPVETERMVYEVMLARLPKWKKFVAS